MIMILYNERIIPNFVWDFVKKLVKNPVKAGILAVMIADFVKKQTDSDLNKQSYLKKLEKLLCEGES